MQKKHIFIPLIALTTLLASLPYHLSEVNAASPSPATTPKATVAPSPSPTTKPADINEVTENLKKRLQETVDSPAPSPTVTATSRSYVGMVKDLIKDTVIIEDKDGKKDIKLQDDTVIVRSPGNATIKADSIRIDDYIIAIGQLSEGDVLMGQRLVVSADPIKPPSKTTGIGTIVKVNKADLILKVDGSEQTILFTTKTTFKSAAGTIELTDLEVGDTLVYTATSDEKSKQTATIFMRIGSTSL